MQIIRSVSFGLLGLAISLFVAGCASTPPAVTIPQVVTMSKEGIPSKEIIDAMAASRTVYRLKASQLAELKSQGVSSEVINYMQKTYLNAVRNDQRLEDWNNMWFEGTDGYWYGGSPYGWPGYVDGWPEGWEE